MKVIFKRDLAKVGKKFQIKDVADGYAINFLIPNGYAVMSTAKAEKEVELMKQAQEAGKKIQDNLLEKNLKALSETVIKISAKTNEKGHLFSAIHKEQIVEELKKQAHIEFPVSYIHLDKPIKEAGEHKIKVGSEERQGTLTLEIK